MNDPIDWAHRHSLRQWSVLAARGHAGAQAVATHYGLAPPASLPPVPARVRALVPQAPRAPRSAVPAVPQTPALTGVARRVDMLQKLVSPPVPPDLV